MEQPANKPTIYYALIHSPGKNWEPILSFTQQSGIEGHANYMSTFLESKKLVQGGPFLDNTGGMMIFNVSKEEANSIANADPCVISGILNVSVKPWLLALSSKLRSSKI